MISFLVTMAGLTIAYASQKGWMAAPPTWLVRMYTAFLVISGLGVERIKGDGKWGLSDLVWVVFGTVAVVGGVAEGEGVWLA